MPRPAKPEPEIDADTDEPGTKPKSKAKPPLKPRAKAAAKPRSMSRSAASAEPAPGPRLDLGHVAALGVHVFTACGAAAGLAALAAVVERDFPRAFGWLGISLVIDGIDGTFARALRVSERAPYIDGALLDLVVDFLTYVIVPVVALWRSDLIAADTALGLGAVIVTSAAVYFADTRMKTADLWFRGFPACWNVVIFYLFVFRPPAWASVSLCLVFAALQFAPIVSVHPLRVTRLRPLPIAVMVLWFFSAGLAIRFGLAGSQTAKLGLGAAALYFILLPFARGTAWARRSGKAG